MYEDARVMQCIFLPAGEVDNAHVQYSTHVYAIKHKEEEDDQVEMYDVRGFYAIPLINNWWL